MKILAVLFKILFRSGFLRKRFFFIYKRIFKPLNLFKGLTALCRYDENMKIMVSLDEWLQQQIYFLGTWDEPGIRFLKNHLKENDVFIDAGANIGAYSMIASKLVGPHGRVIAFEPVTQIFERLVFNIKLNNLQNIDAVRKAVYSDTGNLELFVSKPENMGMSSMYHHDSESGRTENVEAVSIDEYFMNSGLTRIKMIKLDIEGAELFALRGMRTILLRFKPLVLIELNEDVIKNTSYDIIDIISFMKSLNYIQRGIDDKGCLTDPSNIKDYSNFVFIPDPNI